MSGPTVHATARLTLAVCTIAAHPSASSPDHAETSSRWSCCRCALGSVTKRLLCIPVQRPEECKTQGEERWHCPPRGEADAQTSPSMLWHDTRPYAFEAVLASNLLVTLPSIHAVTSQGFELKVVLFVIASSLNGYLNL